MDKLEADQPQRFRIKRTGLARYTLIGVLSVITIVTLAIYYGYATDERLPSFQLKTVEGDEAIGRSVQLNGSYVGRWGNRHMRVGVEGTSYTFDNRLGIFISLPSYERYDYQKRALIQEHRSFMRGKRGGTFEQSQDWLAYVNMVRQKDQARLKLSVLNKLTDQSSNFTFLAGPWSDRDYVFVNDVQIGGEKLYVLLKREEIDRAGRTHNQQFSVLSFDLKTGKFLASREIELPEPTGASFSVLSDGGSQATSPNVVFIVSYEPALASGKGDAVTAEPAASSEPKRIEHKTYLYSYAGGSLTPYVISGPGNFERAGTYLDGDMVYYVRSADNSKGWSSKSYLIDALNLQTQKPKVSYMIKASDLGSEEIGSPRFMNGFLYFIVTGAQKPGSMGRPYTKVAAVEAATGKVAYLGQVEYDGPSEKAADELNQSVLINLDLRS